MVMSNYFIIFLFQSVYILNQNFNLTSSCTSEISTKIFIVSQHISNDIKPFLITTQCTSI